MYLVTHAHPKLIKPRNRGAALPYWSWTVSRWTLGGWKDQKALSACKLSPLRPQITVAAEGLWMHKVLHAWENEMYVYNLCAKANPPTHHVLSFGIIIHIHNGAGAREESALLTVAALRGALNCSNMYFVCVGGPAPPARVCKLPLKTTYSEGIAHSWRSPECIDKIWAHRCVVAVMNMLA